MPHCVLQHVCFALIVVAAAGAAPPGDSNAAAERLKAIKADVAAAKDAFYGAWGKQPDPWPMSAEVEKLNDVYQHKRTAGRDEAFRIATADPSSEVGFEALEYVLSDTQFSADPAGKTAMELMAKHHARNPRVGKAVGLLGYYAPPPRAEAYGSAVALMNAVAEQNPDRAARGQAVLGLAYQAKWAYERAAIDAARGAGPADGVDRLGADAERAFESLLRDYGDCPNQRERGGPPKPALGDEATAELFELRHLQPGKAAPEIEAEDLTGHKFKLSDGRGKVVLLVFWASWCGPCMAQVPHEKELVERYRGRPFELVGVCGDGDKAKAARAMAKENIPWRSFWNGPTDGIGPISQAWNVRGWPTVYTIDHRGVIRLKELYGRELDAPLEKLVAEAEAARADPR